MERTHENPSPPTLHSPFVPLMAVVALTTLAGCAPGPPPPDICLVCEDARQVRSVVVQTPGVRIVPVRGQIADWKPAEDPRDWALVSGEPSPPPFRSDVEYENNRGGGVLRYGGARKVQPNQSLLDQVDRVKWYGEPVRIWVPGRSEALYGWLSLHPIVRGGRGPATRSFAISVPEIRVRQATGGRVSVVYETYRWGRDESFYAWTLYLSDRPI